MTQVYVMRHGPTQENAEVRIQGHRDGTLLVPEAERYIAAVVPLLRRHHVRVLVSSDLGRALATRDMLRQFLQLPHLVEIMTPLLRERSFGIYEGRLWHEVPAAYRKQLEGAQYDFRPFGGESSADVRRRVTYTLRFLARRFPASTVVCITHGGWMQQLVGMASDVNILLDQWSDRSAIYEVQVGEAGQLLAISPAVLQAFVHEE